VLGGVIEGGRAGAPEVVIPVLTLCKKALRRPEQANGSSEARIVQRMTRRQLVKGLKRVRGMDEHPHP
jgi:hypothetical protein